ncbi:hypothetical protein VMW97_001695 [Campylobacter fetus]|nr:hypothetical protein [Campylobacter fetus]
MKEIKKVNDTHIISPVYTIEKTNVDHETGEIKTQNNIIVSQAKKKDDFIKMFVLNLEFIATELENSEKTVLFLMIANMNFKNIINIGTDIRNEIIQKSKMHRNTVSKAISALEEKGVILKLSTDELRERFDICSKNSYLINPDIIGKGSFRDLKTLRQTVVTDFDFETLQIRKEKVIEAKYDDFETIKNTPDNYEITSFEHKISEDKKIQDVDIIIEKKDNNQPSLFDENEQEQKARLFVEKFGGMFSGAFHPTKSAKEMKRELLDQDFKEGRI